MQATDSNSRLEMHVFGWNQGESIVLKLPTRGWGVVDCYSRSLRDPSLNPTYQFLVEQQAEALDFLCLTHPHDDHYRGMSHLLERFPVRNFWYPAAMAGERLKAILKSAHVDAKRSGMRNLSDEAAELQKIFRLVKEKSQQRSLVLKKVAVGTQLFPVPFDTHADLQVWAFAPSGGAVDRYEDGLRKCFDDADRMRDTIPHALHNIVSIGLLVVFGRTRLILGGDVETNGWLDALREIGAGQLSGHAVKVSHHGSTSPERHRMRAFGMR